MTEEPSRTTYVRETQKTGGSTIAFIVAGLVVAVGIIAWLVMGGNVDVSNGTSESTTTNVTIQPAPEPPAVETPSADPAPEAAAPAPAGN